MEIKSSEYLKELKYNACTDRDGLADLLETVGYILMDNGYEDARFFLDDVAEAVYNGEYEI